jgi:hypothetical protein
MVSDDWSGNASGEGLEPQGDAAAERGGVGPAGPNRAREGKRGIIGYNRGAAKDWLGEGRLMGILIDVWYWGSGDVR